MEIDRSKFYSRESIGLDSKTKQKFDIISDVLTDYSDRNFTQPETLRFLIKTFINFSPIFTKLDEKTKLKLLEEI